MGTVRIHNEVFSCSTEEMWSMTRHAFAFARLRSIGHVNQRENYNLVTRMQDWGSGRTWKRSRLYFNFENLTTLAVTCTGEDGQQYSDTVSRPAAVRMCRKLLCWCWRPKLADCADWSDRYAQTGKVTLSKCKLNFTITHLSSRRSKCICRTPNLEFGWEIYGLWKTWHRVEPVRPVQTAQFEFRVIFWCGIIKLNS